MADCIFCGNPTDASGEHVWPEWLGKVVPGASVDMWQIERTVGGPGEPLVRSFRVAPYTEKVNCVCHDCNTGWMSRLEKAAGPHLTPMIQAVKPVRLTEAEQKLIATWASLRAAILDQTVGGNSVPPEHHAWLYAHQKPESRRPPPVSWVRLAAYTNPGEGPPLHQTVAVEAQRTDRPLDPDNPHGHTTTFTVGYLVCHVIGFQGTGEDLTVRDERRLERFTTKVWPSFRIRDWPPADTLDPRNVKRFADAFGSPSSKQPE